MNKNFQSDLTEALAKLNEKVPLALFSSDNDPDNKNVLYIYIRKTGTFHLRLKLKKCIENAFSKC
jgi:hypothetical protein